MELFEATHGMDQAKESTEISELKAKLEEREKEVDKMRMENENLVQELILAITNAAAEKVMRDELSLELDECKVQLKTTEAAMENEVTNMKLQCSRLEKELASKEKQWKQLKIAVEELVDMADGEEKKGNLKKNWLGMLFNKKVAGAKDDIAASATMKGVATEGAKKEELASAMEIDVDIESEAQAESELEHCNDKEIQVVLEKETDDADDDDSIVLKKEKEKKKWGGIRIIKKAAAALEDDLKSGKKKVGDLLKKKNHNYEYA